VTRGPEGPRKRRLLPQPNMGEESTLSARELAEQEKARILEDAAAKTAAIDRDMAELDRLAAKYGLVVSARAVERAPLDVLRETPKPLARHAEIVTSEAITMDGLIGQYVKDKLYTEKRFRTRKYYDTLIFRIEQDFGTEKIADIDEVRVRRAYEEWSAAGKLAISHSLVTMLRILVGFGAKQLRREDCRNLRAILSDLKFPRSKSHAERLTAEHAIAIRAVAHQMGHHSIALAQAFQFDCMLPQKDVIGEWVPQSEPGVSEVIHRGKKWLQGIRWNEINIDEMVLEHTSSFDGVIVRIDLAKAPMVKEEIARLGKLPSSGPVIVREKRAREKRPIPWNDDDYRRIWRKIADVAGVPKNVRSRDSRTPADDDRMRNRQEAEAGRV
jgi:hypothetical protein